MKNLKQQFEDFRNTTPKHVQWLLLGAAFIIVIILLALILTHKSKDPVVGEEPVSFEFNPSNIEFKDVKVGTVDNKSISVVVSVPVVITNVEISAADFTVPNNCENETTDACIINIVYRPTREQKQTNTILKVTWHSESQPEVSIEEKYSIVYSAFEEKIVEPEPEPEPIFEPEPEPIFEPEPEPEPIEAPKDDLSDFIVPNPFERLEPEPEPLPVLLPPEKCSEFAIPGYDQSGRQIGWIKPERGANYFHPFSDKDCSNPTGKYDMATGIITSLTDGSKIGTDSDHIGYRNVRDRNLKVPNLSGMTNSFKSNVANAVGGKWGENADWGSGSVELKRFNREKNPVEEKVFLGSATEETESVISSQPYDRTFILRQFKPIPATIVSEVRADPSVYGCDKAGENCDKENHSIPVRATVDRNVFSDDGRTIILPTGTLLMGYLDGKLPGPYQAFGRMNIKWYQFIRPDGVEFNFDEGQDPYSGDAQGRMGVPGHGSTDYVEQMVMPILTALVPAAVNMIAPITDTVINQIDLDNNTVVQSGTIRSSEMAKQDIINTWNKITQKLLVDAIDNTVPPFSIAAGTRINVFSPVDLIVTCGDDNSVAGKKCAFTTYGENPRRPWSSLKNKAKFVNSQDPSWIGQIRSFNLNQYCKIDKNNKITIDPETEWYKSGYDYRVVLAYCEAQNYQAINNVKQTAYNQAIQSQAKEKQDEYGISYEWDKNEGLKTSFSDADKQKDYNTEVLGLEYDDKGNIINPFAKPANTVEQDVLTCDDGNAPDENGCCPGETYTDMGESYVDEDGSHFACCPNSGGDCFPPIKVEQ